MAKHKNIYNFSDFDKLFYKANEYAENKCINHITIVLGHENQHTSTVNNHSVKHFLNKRNKIELYFKEYSLET